MKKLIPLLLLTATVAVVYVVKKYNELSDCDAKTKEDDLETSIDPIKIEQSTEETMEVEKTAEKVEEQGDAMKLLNLQVDLVMANYPDERIFLVQHHILYENNDKLLTLIKELKEKDYIIVDEEDGITIEKVILQSKDEIKDDIIGMAQRVREDNGIYKGFNILPQ